eukprot:GHVR01160616.1.p2 GENE.GHVR01160616.1~~GHVR01160616.1.p2  ORF type:complete len:104 (+),score=9.50 GHVR01160616.1:383-694(+)
MHHWPNTSDFDIIWNEVIQKKIRPADYHVHHERIQVFGLNGNNTLKLEAKGPSDYHGALIDNVYLKENGYIIQKQNRNTWFNWIQSRRESRNRNHYRRRSWHY